MMFLFVAAFFLLVSGIFILCRISPFELCSQVAGMIQSRRKVKFKQAIKQSIKPKKIRGIKRIVKETQDTLQQENQSSRFPQLIMASFILSIVGVLLASAANNLILAPVLAIGLALIPFLYVLFMSARNRKNLNNALETGLSVITSTYLRTDSIITAVAENVDQLDPQIRPAFQRFLIQANLISPDIPLLLEGMKERIDSSVFHEWIDAMKLCQDDRNLKSTLLPINFALDNQGLDVVQDEFKLTQYQNIVLTTAYDFEEQKPVYNIYSIDQDKNYVLLNSTDDKETATKDFASRSGLVAGDIPMAARDTGRIDQFIEAIKQKGFSLSAAAEDAFRAYDIIDQDNRVVGYIGKNNRVTITTENARAKRVLSDAYIDTNPDRVLLPGFFEKLKGRLKEIGLALKVIFARSGRHYAIQNEKRQEIATVNEQQQVTYTDQATKEQMAKIDAMVEEIRRENLTKQQDSPDLEIPEIHQQAVPEQVVQNVSQSLSNDEIQKLTGAILSNPALTEQLVRLVLSDQEVYSQINWELADKLENLLEATEAPVQKQPKQENISIEQKFESIRQEFNQYLDMLHTVEGFNPERFNEIQTEMVARFGTADLKIFEAKLQHGDFKVPGTLPEKLKVSHEKADRQNAAVAQEKSLEQSKEQKPEKERA